MFSFAKLLTTSVGLLLSAAIHAAPVVVDFDDLSGDNVVLADGYGGIQWGGAWTHYGFVQYPYTAQSGSQRAYANAFGKQVSAFKFASDVKFIGAYFAGNPFETDAPQFELYLDGVFQHSSAAPTISDTPAFLASGYNGLVDEVRVIASAGFYVIDDISYDVTPSQVPEPAGLLLLGTAALAGFAASRRRQKL